ncbi:hypothetical protein D0C16_11350 [Cellvibrio sp. KY-GH-1]|nr:hypothetical protein D0C16_11350 [Cellvibrio sp. KY-GH-1]
MVVQGDLFWCSSFVTNCGADILIKCNFYRHIRQLQEYRAIFNQVRLCVELFFQADKIGAQDNLIKTHSRVSRFCRLSSSKQQMIKVGSFWARET